MIKSSKPGISLSKMVVEVVEASEAAEADAVNEAAGVFKASKSLLRTSKLSRFLNSALF